MLGTFCSNLWCYFCFCFVSVQHGTHVGRVPLILQCKHTVCQECVCTCFADEQVVCVECQTISPITSKDARKLQDAFPVNLYLLGLIYYLKPYAGDPSRLQSVGITYRDRARLQQETNTNFRPFTPFGFDREVVGK